jgi:photosystem II stability/assembly factor-like uncharacterized protein
MKYLLALLAGAGCLFGFDYHGCALAPDNLHGWVVCIDTVLILNTSDGGQSWQVQSTPNGSNKFYDVTCVDELQAWTSGDLGQVLHTDNGGLDWIVQPITLSKNATRIQFLDVNYGWVVGGDGTIGRTTDGGNYWDPNFTPYFRAEYYGLWFIDQYEGWIVAGLPDSLLNGQGYIDHSTDGGINWDSLYQSTGYQDFFDVRFFDNQNGIVIGGDESNYLPVIWKTTNGGLNWSAVAAPANTYYLRALDFAGNCGWAVGRFGSIIHSANAGNSWAFQTNPATTTLFDVDFSDSLHGIACGQNIILYTTDGGQTWNQSAVEENNSREPDGRFFLQAYPNPARRRIEFKLNPGKVHSAERIELKIYDISGRLIRSFTLCPMPSALCWNGTDQSGRPVPAGVYLVRLSNAGNTAQIKLTLLK